MFMSVTTFAKSSSAQIQTKLHGDHRVNLLERSEWLVGDPLDLKFEAATA
jgi:hypothetical protein